MSVNEHARKICVPVILVHHGASLMGSGARPGDRLDGSLVGPESLNGERADELGAELLPKGEATLLDAPKGDRGGVSPPVHSAKTQSRRNVTKAPMQYTES